MRSIKLNMLTVLNDKQIKTYIQLLFNFFGYK